MNLFDQYGRPIKSVNEPEKSAAGPQQHNQQKRTLQTSLAVRIFLGLCTTLALLIFVPRPVVSPAASPTDQRNLMSVSFEVSNTGLTPLFDVSAYLCVGQLGGPTTTPNREFIPIFLSRFTMPHWAHHNLWMDERFAITGTELLGGPLAWGDIAIAVTYKPWILPLHREKLFRFVSYRESDGSVRWRSWPLGEKAPFTSPR